MKNDETVETHPSYGMIQFSRVSGAGHLFGSPLPQHFGTIRVRINHGHRTHSDGSDYYRADKGIAEIELSAAQFAEAITCMNVGDGVPCTLRWLVGVGSVEDVPHSEESEMHRAKESFARSVSSLLKGVRERGSKIKEVLAKDRLTKNDRETITEIVDYVVREVGINAPWMVEQFQDATGKVAAKAKAEVAAMFEHTIRQAGLKHIAALRQSDSPSTPELPAHDDDR